jgi:integrase/recombinase XerD
VGELCGLKWQDLSPTLEGGQISVLGKGTKTRSIRLPGSVWKLLMALPRGREVTNAVFLSRKKRPLSECAQIT